MEFLAATQALDMLRPLTPGGTVARGLAKIRETVPFAKEDRVFAKDVGAICELIQSGALSKVVSESAGELEW